MKTTAPMIVLNLMMILVAIAVGAMVVSNRISLILHATAAQVAYECLDWELWQTTGDIDFKDMELAADIVENIMTSSVEQQFAEMGVDQFVDRLPEDLGLDIMVVLGSPSAPGYEEDGRVTMTNAPFRLQTHDRVWGVGNVDEVEPVYVAVTANWDVGLFLPGNPTLFSGGKETAVIYLQHGVLERGTP